MHVLSCLYISGWHSLELGRTVLTTYKVARYVCFGCRLNYRIFAESKDFEKAFVWARKAKTLLSATFTMLCRAGAEDTFFLHSSLDVLFAHPDLQSRLPADVSLLSTSSCNVDLHVVMSGQSF